MKERKKEISAEIYESAIIVTKRITDLTITNPPFEVNL